MMQRRIWPELAPEMRKRLAAGLEVAGGKEVRRGAPEVGEGKGVAEVGQ